MTTFLPSVSTGYGQTVPGDLTSGYGTINPKPSAGSYSGPFGSRLNGELHHGRVDEHMGDAQYTPIIHTRRECRLADDEKTKKMLFVGQVCTVWKTESGCYCSTGGAERDKEMQLPDSFVPEAICTVSVVASSVDVPPAGKIFAVSLALQDTQTVNIPSTNPKFDASPGDVLYVNYHKGTNQKWCYEISPNAKQNFSWPLGRAILPIDRDTSETQIAL